MNTKKFIVGALIFAMIAGCFSWNIFASGEISKTAADKMSDTIAETIITNEELADTVFIESETEKTDIETVYAEETEIISEESESVQDTESSTESESEDDEPDSYVYDGELFIKTAENLLISPYANLTGTLDYTYWSIHAGAGLGNILEDGRNMDHVGCIMLKVGDTWKTAYCIHHNANLQGGHTYADIESYLTNSEKKDLTGRALYYGFRFGSWNPDKKTVPANADKGKYTATQVMIWMIEKGWYTYDKATYTFSLTSKAISAAEKICSKSDQNPTGSSYSYFNELYIKMQNHDKIPSFSSRTADNTGVYNMGYDFSKNQYTLTLTDKNAILEECTISGVPSGVTAVKNGSSLVLTSSNPINTAAMITLSKKSFKPQTAVTVWSDQTDKAYQQIGTYAAPTVSSIISYFKITAGSVQMSTEKIWNDNENASGNRPSNIVIDLYRGLTADAKTTFVQSVTLDASNNWESTISNLPKIDKDGKRIYYTFFEQVPDGYQSSMTESTPETDHLKHTFINTPFTGGIALLKSSADPKISEKNDCYRLEDAEYTVYSDIACTQPAGVLITDETGKSNVLEDIAAGTYYVKETKCPKGYIVDTEIHEVIVNAGETTVLEVKDTPLNTSVLVQINKLSSDGVKAAENLPLTGTEFTIKFYTEQGLTDDRLQNKVPIRTWVIQTVENKSVIPTAYIAALNQNCLITERSDELYYDSDGRVILPLGTITIEETKAASDYKMEGYLENLEGIRVSENPTNPLIIEIKEVDGNIQFEGLNELHYKNLELKAYNEPYLCSVKIIKSGADRKPLKDVTFTLYNSDGDVVKEKKTDKNGEIHFEGLSPGNYKLIETATTGNNQLLKDPIEIMLPLVLTKAEMDKQKVDPDKCVYDSVNNVYRVYDITYNISNSANLVLPMTGGDNIKTNMLLAAGFLLVAAGGIVLMVRKKTYH